MTTLDISATAPARGERLAIVAFCATIFLSAALLFCMEPLFSKLVLPVLGGSAAVWSIAMVVFQGLLLAGYVYAHLLSRWLRPGVAALVHVTLMSIATLSLPIAISTAFSGPPESGVALWLIGLFLASVGLPCFAISANAPLLQAWFARTNYPSAADPYFLYRASNAGSFLVLLAYPFVIEPSLGLSQQARDWSLVYGVLVGGIALCGAMALLRDGQAPAPEQAVTTSVTSWNDRLRWIALGFVPSGLLVAVTAHIATDVASAPFLWIVPLALYLLTFVLAFTDRPLIPLKALLLLQPASIGILAVLFLWSGKASWAIALPCHLLAFFIAAMVCHNRLYVARPKASDLTAFYAWMSLGGVLGGIFAALCAPLLFSAVLEYPILIVAALLARPGAFAVTRRVSMQDAAFVLAIGAALALPFFLVAETSRIAYFAIAVMTLAAVLAFQGRHTVRLIGFASLLLLVTNLFDPTQSIVLRARSFYGVSKVVELDNHRFRVLFHGTTAHGAEPHDGSTGRPQPLSYYYPGGPFSEAVAAARDVHGGRFGRVALVGLGIGSLTCSSKPGEQWTLYELDPLVVAIAKDASLFRSLSQCAPHAPIVVGDGRLTLAGAKPGLDLLVLDVFSSDSVPTHLLTREAFALYLSKLGPHGMIAFNISNRNMQLANVVAASAHANGLVTMVKTDQRDLDSTHTLRLRAEIAVVARSENDLRDLRDKPGWAVAGPMARVWTDDYSNVLGAILQKLSE